MDHVFAVRHWRDHFETAESRKIKGSLTWIPVPTKHDGRGYRRVCRHPHGVQALAGWWSLLQVAAKMPIRGLLADRDGPLDAQDIADKTNLPKKIYETALAVMSEDQIGWLESLPWDQNLDFAGNIRHLSASQRLPADTSIPQRISADTSGHQRAKKQRLILGNASGDQRRPAETSAPQRRPAETSGDQRTPADASVQYSTVQTEQVPPTVPQGGQEQGIGFDEARELLNHLFGRTEKRRWSFEESELLSKALPISREEWPLIETWFRLPLDHPVFEVTKRKQELTTFLRDFNGEIDKIRRHASLFRSWSVNGSGRKKEPAHWKEFFRWHYADADMTLPTSFWLVPEDKRKIYEQRFDDFVLANPEVPSS